MQWLTQLFTRLRRHDELSETIREHLEEKIVHLMDDGMTREEAELSCREFGNVMLIEELTHEVWHWPTLESILSDLRFALRQYCKAPGFTLTAILVLALGIAASVSIFAFVNAALLKPLPFQAPSRLVAVFENTVSCPQCSISYPDYQDWKSSNQVLRSFEIWGADAYLWRSPAGAVALRAGRVSGGFFQTLGVTPALGRLFTSADDTPEAQRTVVLPYATWQRLFGGRADILGQSITLDNNAYTVVGVLPRNFQFAPRAAELWVTIHDLGSCERDRSCRSFYGLARLKDGVTVSAAQANTSTVAAQLQKQYPQSNQGQGALVMPLSDSINGDIRPILLILLAGSVLLLLIACVNVASLLLVRAEGRRREMAVRGALGASLARIARQLIIEAALLVALSVSFGQAAAWGAVDLLAALIPERVLRGMPFFQTIGFDHRVLLFVAAVSLAALAVCRPRLCRASPSLTCAPALPSEHAVPPARGDDSAPASLSSSWPLPSSCSPPPDSSARASIAFSTLISTSILRTLPRLRLTPTPTTTPPPGSSPSLPASFKRSLPFPASNLWELSALTCPSLATATKSPIVCWAARGMAHSSWLCPVP